MFRLVNKYESCKFYKQHIGLSISKFKTCISTLRSKSYYHALELDSTASSKDIKLAYYKLSLQYHPDKNNGSEESVAKFREITEAYETLSNAEKKKKYDEGFNFQQQHSSSNRQTESSYRSARYQGPFTGRSKGFDHDEHYRKHYQDFQKQRDAEFEYFKRRWEAEFYRRYPTADHYYRNRHKHSEQVDSEQIKKRLKERRHQISLIFGVWIILFFVTIFSEWNNPERRYKPYPIYYHSSKKENEGDVTENKEKRDL